MQAAYGQQLDAAIGFGTLSASSSSTLTSDHTPQSIGGGVFPTISGDVLLKHNLGVQGEVTWRVGKKNFLGDPALPFRPILYDFNGIYAPRFGRAGAELMAGIGAESLRFYGTLNCGFAGCTNYTSSSHFMGHFGAGLRLYATSHVFIRPEVHVYLIHNNVELSSGRAIRYGGSIGYTFGFNQ